MELLKWCRLQWDRVLAVVAMVGGVVALVLGWGGASNTEYVAKQIPYVVSGGLGCLALLMIGGTLWLSADFRDEWRALDRLEDRLEGLDAHPVLEELGRRLERLEQLELTAARSPQLGEAGPGVVARTAGPSTGIPDTSSGDGGARR